MFIFLKKNLIYIFLTTTLNTDNAHINEKKERTKLE